MSASTNVDFADMTPERAEAWLKEYMEKVIFEMLLSSAPIADIHRGIPIPMLTMPAVEI